MLSSDKTSVSKVGSQVLYPVLFDLREQAVLVTFGRFATLRFRPLVNVPKFFRKKGSLRTKIVVAFIPSLKVAKADRRQPWFVDLQRALFHYCQSVLLTPLRESCIRYIADLKRRSVPFKLDVSELN